MKSSGSGKKSDKSATTIGDFFPSKKSTKNKRNKDEKERSGKKLKKNESALKTCPICTKDFHWTLIDAHASECVGGGDFDLDDFDAFEKTKKSSFSFESFLAYQIAGTLMVHSAYLNALILLVYEGTFFCSIVPTLNPFIVGCQDNTFTEQIFHRVQRVPLTVWTR